MEFNKDDGYCFAYEHGVNMVTGERNFKICSAQRLPTVTTDGYCGKNGFFFSPLVTE